jgi:hypothetical protein
LTNVTVTGNQANWSVPGGIAGGGGLYNKDAKVTLVNTLVAGNTINLNDIVSGPDLRGEFISGGHNLIGIADNFGITGAGDRTGTTASPLDPRLGPLQDNGGPTPTMLPLPGSPLLGTGDPTQAPSTDQRGLSRPAGGPTDIGAVQETGVPGTGGGGGSTPANPAPTMPALHTPLLLALFDQLLDGVKRLNGDGTVTVTDSFLGLSVLVSTYSSAGGLVNVSFFGLDVTALFKE